ncbi:exosortase/archaeosortase family protein [Leifsonia shinshuensis]|uniref:Exosortase/archaeosortase family protein n=1 Tax=Leifsonia shinshuensis TaxID=150026 RepID=A0A7G6Y9X0_9MICO|nr:exosortase/archaeosortase family protein [Leifsonia shinshuensis]QNE35285.1 hypothetical protein F1C12_09175 [Leifsonia shinshuensis]
MSDTPLAPTPSARRTARRRRASVPQLVLAALLTGLAVALVVLLERAVQLEAHLFAQAIPTVLGASAALGEHATITVGAGGPMLFSMSIGLACSIVLLLVPFLLIAAALLATGRISVLRALFAVAIGAVLLEVVNTVRVLVIAALTLGDGVSGFGWGHTLVGSVIVLAGLLLTTAGMLWIAARGRKGQAVTA